VAITRIQGTKMHDSLGDRMKTFYEGPARYYLTRRTPVVVRLDGRAFHTLTKGFQKPYDASFIETMDSAARCLFDEMQGCKMAYIQSDEASFVLTDYDTLTTEAWFGYNKSKLITSSGEQRIGTVTRYRCWPSTTSPTKSCKVKASKIVWRCLRRLRNTGTSGQTLLRMAPSSLSERV
jgi:tRNA(His) guanylyltransferase